MDEDEATPGRDATPGGGAPAGAPGAPPPPPAYPVAPSYPPAPQYPAWIAPASAHTGPRIDVGSVLGRTFDTFGREWSLFLVLAIPAAVASALRLLITPTFESQVQNRFAATTDVGDPWALFVVSVIVATAVGFSALASVVAADRLWRGQPAGILDTASTVVRSIPRAIPVWLLIVLAQAAIVVFTTQLTPQTPVTRQSLAASSGAAALVLLAIPLVIVGAIVAVVIQARLSLVLPVIALEEGSPGSVIPRTWRLTKGNVIMLFGCSLLIGLCVSVTAWGSTLFLLFGANRIIAGVALAIAELVTAPLTGIWVAIAWGDLVGGRHADNELMARGRGRWTTATIVFGLGALLVVAGLGVTGAAITRLGDPP
jgi:hypothetical protein